MLEYYFTKSLNQLCNHAAVPFICEEVKKDSFVINLLSYYFPDNHMIEQDNSKQATIEKAVSLIKDSSYSDGIKARLYEYLLMHNKCNSELQIELKKRMCILSNIYENETPTLDALKDNFHLEQFLDAYTHPNFKQKKQNQRKTYTVSFSLLNPNTVFHCCFENHAILLLGKDYHTSLDSANNVSNHFNIETFLTAANEKSRVKILQYLLTHPKASSQELADSTGIVHGNIYHHLERLEKAELIQVRKQGYNNLYSLNDSYILKMVEYIQWLIEAKSI